MNLTIKTDDGRFNLRVGAIIYNSDKTKIFMQKQEKIEPYMFPGGRIDMYEDSYTSMKRKLEEELGIKDEDMYLKYIAENFVYVRGKKLHEVSFYYVLQLDEEKYGYYSDNIYHAKDEEHDGKSIFKWINISDLDNIDILPNNMKDKIKNIKTKELEHIIHKEY